MSTPIIEVKDLSKQYAIGERAPYGSLREEIMQTIATPFKKKASSNDTIWALKDVSFEVREGDVLGIIGRNGAGKTTLLKILSRITEPTRGEVKMRGRVGSLLEVGTGFHPELTGRENVFLNGALLGMHKEEIKKKFDEIVAFAEIEKLLDTPVKRYSSGMNVRLAFAVAAHLEPEILLVDEVLAVGDAAFQKKCLGKMGEVAKQGRTVLFVSHSMGAITRLCQDAVWLDEGTIQKKGAVEHVVSSYLSAGSEGTGEVRWDDQQKAPGDEHIRLTAVRMLDSSGTTSSSLDIRLPFYVEIEYEILRVLSSLRIGFRIITADGVVVFTSSESNESTYKGKSRTPGKYVSRCEIPGNLLNEGQYTIFNVWADIPFVKVMFAKENVVTFQIVQTGSVGGRYPERWSGVICPALQWTITNTNKYGGSNGRSK